MHIEWWVWLCLGIFMLLIEATSAGGFYLLFVGIAALVAGAVSPIISSTWIVVTLFAVLSIVLIALFRKPLVEKVRKSTPNSETPEFIGETGCLIEKIESGKEGKIELRGTTWTARNTGTTDLHKGASCTVIAREGLTFLIN